VWDIKFAGYEHYVGMDSILNNAIFISPFWGNYRCSWCDIVIVTTGLPTLISHILCEHRRIQQSHFSCPCCIGTAVLNWDSWPGHFERNHAPGQAFAMVLNELAANSRYGWGIALMAAISCCTLLGAELDDGDEPEARVTPWGGYCPRTQNANALVKRIKQAREQVLPTALHEARPVVRQQPASVGRAGGQVNASFRRGSFASVASFSSTRPGTPAGSCQGPKTPMSNPYDPSKAVSSGRAAPYTVPEYRPSTLSLETPVYEPITPARAGPAEGMSFERVVDDLEMTMESFPSDGSGGGGGEASDSLLDGGDKDDGDGGKGEHEDDEMGGDGDNF
jgi:hypothetical protein